MQIYGLTSALRNAGKHRKRGCEFWGPEEMGYQALLWSRVANGVWELLQRRERVFDREVSLFALDMLVPRTC
jgi:hypothetical protein